MINTMRSHNLSSTQTKFKGGETRSILKNTSDFGTFNFPVVPNYETLSNINSMVIESFENTIADSAVGSTIKIQKIS